MKIEAIVDISYLKEIIYILNNVDVRVIKNPIALQYFENKVCIWDSDGIIEIFDLGKITHRFVKE